MSRPRVSIVTPSYNQSSFLAETLESVLAQDYPEIEYIVVDDGSTDGSLEIARSYEDRIDALVVQENAGQVAALNAGFARASGDLLGWINSDDTLLPGAVSAVVDAFERDPSLSFVYGDNVLLDAQSRDLGLLRARPFDVVEMLRTCQNHVPQPGSLFRRETLDAVPLDPAGYYYFDFQFVLGLGLLGRAERLERPLGGYRLHDESKSLSAPVRKAEDHLRAFDTFFSQRDLPPHVREVERESRSRSELVAAAYFYAALEQRRARRHVLRGLRLFPRHATAGSLTLLAKTMLPRPVVRRLRELRAADDV